MYSYCCGFESTQRSIQVRIYRSIIFELIVRCFSVNLSVPLTKSMKDEWCTIEPDPNNDQTYLIYINNDLSTGKTCFGQLSYELCNYDNYLYTILIGRKLYKVRSCDLKDRRLAMIDTLQTNSDPCSPTQCPETLFQMIDSFSKSNKTYHVTINDKEKHLGYLAIVILLDLHEHKRR